MDEIRKKIVRIATVPISLKILTRGQLKFLNDNGYDVYTISANGPEINSLIQDEKIIEHFSIDLSRKISPIKDLKAIWQCYLILKKLKPNIVHTYTPKAGMVGMIASYFAGSKIRLHNVTGLPLMELVGFKKSLLIFIEKITYLLSTKVYVNSIGLLGFIKSNIIDNSKIVILGNGSTNGIDGEFYKSNESIEKKAHIIKQELGILKEDFVWIFVGRLVKDKGINELIDVFDEMSKDFLNMKLVLVGGFEADLDPIDELSKLKMSNNNKIISVGFKDDVRPYYVLSDCLVFPSYREGLPNVPMQAACFNLPIIATNINGCNEIVLDQENGLLIKPKSKKELKDAMIKIYASNKFSVNLSINTRKMVLDKYDKKVVWYNLLKEYQLLLMKN